MGRLLALVFLLSLAGCAPACSDASERALAHDVELLVADDGPIGEAAAERVIRRGRRAIAVLETGLYQAEAPARRRVVRTLGALRTPEVAPILRHLARRDPDPEVRAAADAALRGLTHF